MRVLFILIVLISCGCATHSYYWQQETWAKTNQAEAHNDCTVKARIAIGQPNTNIFNGGYNVRQYNGFMQECMAGQGYTLITR